MYGAESSKGLNKKAQLSNGRGWKEDWQRLEAGTAARALLLSNIEQQ